MRNFLILLIALFFSFAFTQELLINGDFEQELTVGWTFVQSGSGTHLVNRDVSYHPDPDYEAMAYQYDNPGWTKLSQTVFVPGPMLELTFTASFAESGGVSTCWPAACFSVCYLDADDNVLGETRYYYSTYADWTSTSTLHLIRIYDPNWNTYSLDIAEELANNLPGVNLSEVVKVEVALYAYTHSG
uniref:CBM-cenC domain-containing protein n=1 Tax=candidate division WOR-3 bacterium TaxID=2052148 RepID=A0A7C6A9W1_UNCW3